MTEQWQPVLDGLYEVSDEGRIRRAVPGRRTWPGRILKPQPLPNGYLQYAATINGRNVNHYLHALVAEAFIGPTPDGMEVNHKDGNKHNNNLSNLEYVTRLDNVRHAIATGLCPHQVKRPRSPKVRKERHIYRGAEHWMHRRPERVLHGEQCASHKVTQAQVDEIRRRVAAGEVQRSLCQEFGISPAQVCRIVNGKRWVA